MSGRVEVTTVPKPWGHETIWAKTDRYVGKILHIKAGHALSVQYHNRKDETVFLLAGVLKYWVQAAQATGHRPQATGLAGLRTAGTGETPVAGRSPIPDMTDVQLKVGDCVPHNAWHDPLHGSRHRLRRARGVDARAG
jgi:hypothetical protein